MPRKILIAANSFAVRGGVEARTLDLCELLRKLGSQVELVTLRIQGDYTIALSERDIRTHDIHCFSYRRGFVIPNPLGIIKLSSLIKRYSPDAILGVQAPSHYFLRMACLLSGKKCTIMERLSYEDRSFVFRCLDKFLSSTTRACICVSRSLAKEVLRAKVFSDEKVHAIENGSQPPLPGIAENSLERSTDQNRNFVFGCVGSLSFRKRQSMLIRAFAKAYHELRDLNPKLLLVGGLDDDDSLVSLANDLGVGEQVVFAGHQENVSGYLQQMDVFCFPSVKEGLGTAWVEALWAKLPLIITNLAPFNDYIEHEITGLLFEADNSDDLSRKMVRLATTPELRSRLSENGFNLAKKDFDAETNLRRIVELL